MTVSRVVYKDPRSGDMVDARDFVAELQPAHRTTEANRFNNLSHSNSMASALEDRFAMAFGVQVYTPRGWEAPLGAAQVAQAMALVKTK
jgi:hypothetical protein